jgi:serine/threonine-protein kinase
VRDRDPISTFQSALGDQYILERELPRGGMSRVFVATESALGRHVVVKVLSSEVAATLSADRFKREIAMAARLQHPHIVPLLSAGQADKYLYYTMPLVTGESLRERMDRERPMAIADITRILAEVASALGYAHAEGMAHRDMKPENVMFYHGHAVVLDFGIGKALTDAVMQDPAFPRFKTSANKPLGTPMYMAPEQTAADPSLDHRADLYALGVVAYEMITGHPPFAGTTQAIFTAHAKNVPDPIAKRREDVPPQLAAIVMRALEKEPAKRPQSGEEIVHAVADIGSGAVPWGVPKQLARMPVWFPWAIAVISTGVAIILALLLSRSR